LLKLSPVQSPLMKFLGQPGRPGDDPARRLGVGQRKHRVGRAACLEGADLLEALALEEEPRAGRGVGCVEAPRGTLIHDYSTDENGLITRANLIVGTTHNLGPMNLSVKQAARMLIQGGEVTEGILNRIEMAVRAYDP